MGEQLFYKYLEPEEYHLIDRFFDEENSPRLDPRFSKALVAMTEGGEVVGMICVQLVAHAEPIIIDPEWRQKGVGKELVARMDGYLEALGVPGVYTQPTNPAAEALTKMAGFVRMENPLYMKLYLDFNELIPRGDVGWDLQ